MNDDEIDLFMLGKSFFRIPWVEAPSATTARDGLGPLFNANTCTSCHPGNGVGKVFTKEGNVHRALISKLSIPSNGSKEHQALKARLGLVPEPSYGPQVAINGVYGVPFEAKPILSYEELEVVYPDGEKATLLKPKPRFEKLGYGAMHKDVIVTNRLAPALIGLGFLEQIPQEDILANVDEKDSNNDGISGKANFVNFAGKKRLGRFTWKASAATVKQQIAAAMSNDMGLTSPLFPDENCMPTQKECQNAPKGRDKFDVPMQRLDAVNFYMTNLKVPLPREDEKHKEGKELFEKVGCTSCHKASFKTASGIKLAPYTDLLLHDMGEGLSDGRSEFLATANEWRTPPLWGIGLYDKVLKAKARLLHDGRARNYEEAILWHGGEAKNVKKRFMKLSKDERSKILHFLGTL